MTPFYKYTSAQSLGQYISDKKNIKSLVELYKTNIAVGYSGNTKTVSYNSVKTGCFLDGLFGLFTLSHYNVRCRTL